MKKLLALALVCLLTLTLTAYAATNAAALLRRGDANAYEGDLRGLAPPRTARSTYSPATRSTRSRRGRAPRRAKCWRWKKKRWKRA